MSLLRPGLLQRLQVLAHCDRLAQVKIFPTGVLISLRKEQGQRLDQIANDVHGGAFPSQLLQSRQRALPGGAEKIAVLTQRAAERRELWHPEDGKGIALA